MVEKLYDKTRTNKLQKYCRWNNLKTLTSIRKYVNTLQQFDFTSIFV